VFISPFLGGPRRFEAGGTGDRPYTHRLAITQDGAARLKRFSPLKLASKMRTGKILKELQGIRSGDYVENPFSGVALRNGSLS
jgi:hypothetical protein